MIEIFVNFLPSNAIIIKNKIKTINNRLKKKR